MAEQVYFIMKNPKMQTFCDLDLPILRVARGALRVEPKNKLCQKTLMRSAPEPYAEREFPPAFGGLTGVQIGRVIARWKYYCI